MSEGAAYGTDQAAGVYSPYSPYRAVGSEALYAKVDDSKFYKEIVTESEKRFANYPAYISKKSWLDVKTENTRYLYSLRKAMNGLAKTADQKAAAKKVYLGLEKLTYAATVKSQADATAALEETKAAMAAYKKAVGM